MPFKEEWIPASQALTIEDLAAQNRPSYFRYNNKIYLGFLAPEPIPESQDIWYKAIARDEGRPTRFPGSTLVTPMTLERVTLI
jgi:hypothetical protein